MGYNLLADLEPHQVAKIIGLEPGAIFDVESLGGGTYRFYRSSDMAQITICIYNRTEVDLTFATINVRKMNNEHKHNS